MEKKKWTICFLIKKGKRPQQICLAMKKRGWGAGFWNGVGGKIKGAEELETAVRREAEEEINVKIQHLEQVAEIDFIDPNITGKCYVFLCEKWDGDPRESDEMKPQWFPANQMPFDNMWSADKLWLPRVLEGKKIRASFIYKTLESDEITDYDITEIDII